MTFPVTKVKTRDQYGVTFSAPTEPGLTVRFKTTSSQKSIDGQSMVNHVSEVIVNDLNNVTVSGESVNDPISVRLRISGSVHSRARLTTILTELADRITTWDSEDAYIGFEPSTVPGQAA